MNYFAEESSDISKNLKKVLAIPGILNIIVSMMKAKPTIKPSTAIAATLGLTPQELSEYRYKAARTPQAIYSIGNEYYAAGNVKPKFDCGFDDGAEWRPVNDQFWAEKAHTVIWVGKIH